QNGSEQSVTETVSEDQHRAVTFAFLHSSQMFYPFPRIYLRGLKPDAMYQVAAFDGKLSAGSPVVASGTFWMQHGVDVDLRGDFQAAAFTLDIVVRSDLIGKRFALAMALERSRCGPGPGHNR